MNKAVKHYNYNYFENYQKKMGLFGGKANLFLFEKYISENDKVLDFGCGGGFLLSNLKCKQKFGVEINEISRANCIEKGIECYENIDFIEDSSIDVIISSHCLEHTTSPYDCLEKFYKKLKNNGTIVVVVPTDSYRVKFKKDDINYHLYSFSPMNLGNLLDSVGFDELKVKPVFHKWPPYYYYIQKYFGWNFFHCISYIYGVLSLSNIQIRAIAKKSK